MQNEKRFYLRIVYSLNKDQKETDVFMTGHFAPFLESEVDGVMKNLGFKKIDRSSNNGYSYKKISGVTESVFVQIISYPNNYVNMFKIYPGNISSILEFLKPIMVDNEQVIGPFMD